MLPDRVSNPGPLTYESSALPIALRGPAANALKVVICGKYKNLNKITKFNISPINLTDFLFSLFSTVYNTMQNSGTCRLKSVLIQKDQREFFTREYLKK